MSFQPIMQVHDGVITSFQEFFERTSDVGAAITAAINDMRQQPCMTFALQVIGLDVSGDPIVPTSWDVALELSLDGINFGPVLTHVNGTEANGDIVALVNFPATFLRIRINELTLGGGGAVNLKTLWLAKPH